MKFYGYKKCSTCRKAETFLKEGGVNFDYFDITETPPSKTELKKILKNSRYPIKKLFNTSGQVYRDMGLKEKVDSLEEAEAIELLASNGKLIKRPIAFDETNATVGFTEEEYRKNWL